MSWTTLRTIVEELDVSETVDLLNERFPRFDEAWEGLKWLLSRTPDLKSSAIKSTDNGEYRAYVLDGDLAASIPDVWVVYTFSAIEVVILGVHAVEQAPDKSEG